VQLDTRLHFVKISSFIRKSVLTPIMGKQKNTYYYAVKSGRNPGIYENWNDCKSNVNGYSGAEYKKFETEAEARDFANGGGNSNYGGSSNYGSSSNYGGSSSNYGSRGNSNYGSSSNYESGNRSSSHHSTDRTSNHQNYVIRRSSPEPVATTYGKRNDNDRVLHSTYIRVAEAPRATPQVSKRKYSDDEYNQNFKQRKYEASGSTHIPKRTKVVYTDGASANNGKSYASAGYGVYWGDNDSRNASVKLPGKLQTNQRAEASAVIHALEQTTADNDTLEIRTDSQYVINAATSWSKKWVENGWKASNGKEVQNRDLFEKMVNLMDKRKGEVKFTYVPGHQGVDGNEKADRLAVSGARK
jgi:ribonuclease HI